MNGHVRVPSRLRQELLYLEALDWAGACTPLSRPDRIALAVSLAANPSVLSASLALPARFPPLSGTAPWVAPNRRCRRRAPTSRPCSFHRTSAPDRNDEQNRPGTTAPCSRCAAGSAHHSIVHLPREECSRLLRGRPHAPPPLSRAVGPSRLLLIPHIVPTVERLEAHLLATGST